MICRLVASLHHCIYCLLVFILLYMQVVQLFSCLDKISYIEWAPDSEYLLCGLHKRPVVQAWSLNQPDWTCKIDDGPSGIAYARWSPDSRHIITTSDFLLRLTVWSLVNTACVHVQWPKHATKGVSFTKDGKFAAICTRRDCKDYINLLSCHTWEIMGVFSVDTIDLADIEWSPDDTAIVVWDSLLEYKVSVYLFHFFFSCLQVGHSHQLPDLRLPMFSYLGVDLLSRRSLSVQVPGLREWIGCQNCCMVTMWKISGGR